MTLRITIFSLILCFSLLGVPTPLTEQRAAAGAKPITVKLYVDQLVCNHITKEEAIPLIGSNDRDEVYLKVHASSPGEGKTNERLPLYKDNDDYYEFTKNQRATKDRPGSWTNHNQAPVGAPILWSGTLQPGEHAEVLAFIGEQDNKDLKDIKMGIQLALAGLSKTVAELTRLLKSRLKVLPRLRIRCPKTRRMMRSERSTSACATTMANSRGFHCAQVDEVQGTDNRNHNLQGKR